MLYRGLSNPDVLQLNRRLNDLGYVVPLLNTFDLPTEAAVRTFQERSGLTKDGIVGPKTLAALATTKPLLTAYQPIKWLAITNYFSQRDNEYSPSGTCNVTSLAMVLNYWGVQAKEGQLEDQLFQDLLKPEAVSYYNKTFPQFVKQGYNARNVHGMLGWLAQQYGFKWKHNWSTRQDQINSFAKPMITSGSFTGAGHIVCITGMTNNGDWIIHDPWGDWNTAYKNRNGAYRIYNSEAMSKVLAGGSATDKQTHMIWK